MSDKAKDAIDAVSKAYDMVSKWMYDKEELGEDTEELDKYGNQVGDVIVDWLEQLSEINDRMIYYAEKWGDIKC